ncbi:hypothetical protein [Clostridium cochlearium]|uniref:hypothetical protein n=1 Tax=Clostridium cochlearium TaxID=1494 RepID=UPI000B94DFE7|nr:hypothetical protein [Clostridium cochlearium]SNV87788.1 Uncharacterised protein [Clostridium cochlearium]STA93590.1 Uncharacterised protein [Clostridium cochlearium]
MSERAYSLELNRSISAKQASDFSINGRLHDKRAFQCSDPNCRINMTCTNWNKKGIRYFFTPSSQEELHVIGCSELSEEEVKEQEKLESDLAKKSIKKNGLIRMTKSVGKAKSNDKINLTTELTNEQTNRTTSSKSKVKNEARHVYPIASFVNLFEDTELDKDSQIIVIENEKISLNELFLESKNNFVPYNRTRIIYGEAVIRTAEFGDNMLEIEFINSKLPKIYSNIKSVSKNKSTSQLKKFLDTNKKVVVYYRGKLIKNGTKFESFNDSVFKDIYF